MLLNDIAIFEIFKEGPGKIYIKTSGEGKAAIRLQNKKKYLNLALLSNSLSLPTKTTCYVFGFFHRGKICKKPISKNIAVLFFKSHSSAPATLDRERCRFSCRYRMLKKISIEIS